MSFWNNSTPEQRITEWRELRTRIENLPAEEQVEEVAKFFANFPIGARSIDYYTPSSWPSPWEIFHHSLYCRSSISLLMYDTLRIINTNADVCLCLINDGQDTYLAPIIDNNSILNYSLGAISNWHEISNVRIIDNFEGDIDRHYR